MDILWQEKLIAIFVVRNSRLLEWEVNNVDPVTWLSTIAVDRRYSKQGVGVDILKWVQKNFDKPIYLDCVDCNSFLPDFYRGHGFKEVKRMKLYGSSMVLMCYS